MGHAVERRAGGDRAVPLLAGLLAALPVLIARYPPMMDLPHHEEIVAILRHFGDEAYFPRGLYVLNFGHPNQLFYGLAWALSFVVKTDLACKIVVAAIQVSLFLAAGRLAGYLGASRWTALLLMPVALGWTFFWGLISNLLGIAALLFALPALDRFARSPTRRGALLASLVMLLLDTAHESAMVLGCAGLLIFALAYPLRAGATALRVLPIGSSAALYLAHQAYARPLITPSVALLPSRFTPPLDKLLSVPRSLVGHHDPFTQCLLVGVAVAAVVSLGVDRRRAGGAPWPRAFTPFVQRYRFELLALLAFAAYWVMPYGFRGATHIDQRFVAPAFAVIAVAAAPRGGLVPSALSRGLCAAVPLSVLAVVWPQFVESDRCFRDLDGIIAVVHEPSSVALIELDPESDGVRIFSASRGASRIVAERGGRALSSLVRSQLSPVMVSPRVRWDESECRLLVDTLRFIPAHDLTQYRYALVHDRDPRRLAIARIAMIPEARHVETFGEWMLLESTLPVAPLVSVDRELPSPKPPSLRKRLNEVAKNSVVPLP